MRDRSVWGIHDNSGPGTTDPSGCGWYRIILPLQELGRHGWRTGWKLGMPDWDPGIFVGQRFDQPQALPMWKALKGHFPLAYELDDDPFCVDPANWMVHSNYARAETLDTIRECAAIADVVTVTTRPLAEVLRRESGQQNITVIPNYIPESMLALKRPRHEMLTIGWAGGVSHMRDVALIAQTWRDVIDETGCRGHFVGADYGNMLRRPGFDFTAWALDPAVYYQNIDFDIGLIPIADHPFAQSKSWIKALEFAALGIPVIASDCEAYREFVIDGVTGFLCANQEEWQFAMLTLVRDHALREKMGGWAKERAAAFTIEKNYVKWEAVYQPLLEET